MAHRRSVYTFITGANIETNKPDGFTKLKGIVMSEADKAEAEAAPEEEADKADAKKGTSKKS